jgi:hypothetical protein
VLPDAAAAAAECRARRRDAVGRCIAEPADDVSPRLGLVRASVIDLHLGALAGQEILHVDRALCRIGPDAVTALVEPNGGDLGSLRAHAYANNPAPLK